MKITHIISIISISLLSLISCFAGINIENPYENVRVKLEQKSRNGWIERLEVQVILNEGNIDEIKFAPKKYRNLCDYERFEEEFSIGSKKGEITYSINVKCEPRVIGKQFLYFITLAEIKIISFSIDGKEMPQKK